MINKLTTLFLALFTASLFVACGEQEDPVETLKKDALIQYADLVLANYDDSYNSALTLKQAIDAFLAAPTDAGFEACKTAWLIARNPYGQSEAFRFYGGPIDDADGPEGLINAWPMDENFIDYVQGQPNAGLINSPGSQPVINKSVLVGLNEVLSETAIFTGWHAIEFLLWGQDLSISGPGARPFTDYIVGGGGTAANQDRRGQYLQVAVDLLLEHLAQVRDEWKTSGVYRQEFLNDYSNNEAMGLIFFGLREFTKTEIAGERMFVAFDTQDQEHEHSCFADNTIADLKMNLLGLKNVYYGHYKYSNGIEVSGKSFNDLVEFLDPAKAAAVRVAFEDAEAKMNAIPAPFDQAIANSSVTILPTISALEVLGDRLAEAGKAIGAEF
ncbi:MAG: imelysin family protein [Saprospiraceae bacterium]|nr:imelysin family protein [Saprospiraceae bacterium]